LERQEEAKSLDLIKDGIARDYGISELRSRYRGSGVLVYCHVETNAVCIYSQLRSFSSSEVAAMIEGLVRHDTGMRVEKNFVDSYGQSEVAFAFCHLLGTVRLMPRLRRIKL
jgi:TnpA family transposase